MAKRACPPKKSHRGPKPLPCGTPSRWTCDVCGESYRTSDELEAHKREDHWTP